MPASKTGMWKVGVGGKETGNIGGGKDCIYPMTGYITMNNFVTTIHK